MTDHDIQTDGTTVWVHSSDGHTIARFGRLGIDVHTADSTGCLHCTHEPTGPAEWDQFTAAMLEHHGVTIPDDCRPERCYSGT